MSRLQLVEPDQVSDHTVQRIYGEIQRELGFGIVPNVFKAMGTQPWLLEANWLLFKGTVLQGRLPRVVKEMIGVVVSVVHGSGYARDVHLHSLAVQGVNEEARRSLAGGLADDGSLAPSTLAALRFAKRAAGAPTAVTDSDFAALAEAGLSRAEISEIVATVELFSAVNTFTDVAGVELDRL